jgi:hypothetical protein
MLESAMIKMIEKAKLQNAAQSQPVQPHYFLDRNWLLTQRAEFAKELVRGGMIGAAMGQCREQYQEMRMMSPNEVVQRACDIADTMYEEFERRAWFHEIPLHDEQVKELLTIAPSPVGFSHKPHKG